MDKIKLNSNTKRRRTPTLLQMEALECGSTALGIIMRYMGKYLPLEILREDCGVSRDGTRASYLVKAGEYYGLESAGFKAEYESLNNFKTPFIAFWNFNHFLVVDGFDKNKAYLNDPAVGPVEIGHEEFKKKYSGVILTFKQTDKFVKDGQPPDLWPKLVQRLKGQYSAILFLFVVGLTATIPGIIIPLFDKIFIDSYLIGKMTSIGLIIVLGLIFTNLLSLALNVIQELFLMKFEHKLSIMYSTSTLWHILNLPVRYFEQRYAGDITGRIDINKSIAEFMTQTVVGMGLNVIMVVFYFIVMISLDVVITLVALALSLINYILMMGVRRLRRDKSQLLTNEGSRMSGHALSGMNLIETLKASGREGDFLVKLFGSYANSVNARQELAAKTMFINTIPSLLNLINTSFILAFGSYRIMQGDLTPGILIAIQSLVGKFTGPLSQLIGVVNQIQEMQGNINKVDDVLNYKTQKDIDLMNIPKNELALIDPPKLKGKIDIKNVSFGYNKLGKPVLKNFNISISPGQRVAIVGESGSGKSTFAKLLTNMHPAWEGQILYDDIPIEEINRMVLLNSVSMVNQEIFLFNATVRNNLTMWDETIPFKNILHATKDADIHDVISRKNRGYDEVLIERGANLSGGQKQRIEIARALVSNPRVLILDEATSSLDPITERKIDDNLRQRGCTIIIIAHRLSTVKTADKIIVLKNGEIAQMGTHKDLLYEKGPYKDLLLAN